MSSVRILALAGAAAAAMSTAALAAEWEKLGASKRDVKRVFSTFYAAAAPFRKESEAHGE